MKDPVFDWRFHFLAYAIAVFGVLVSIVLAPLHTTPGLVLLLGMIFTGILALWVPRRVLAGRIKPDCMTIVTPSGLLTRFRVFGGLVRRHWEHYESVQLHHAGGGLQRITITGRRRRLLLSRSRKELFFEAAPEEAVAVYSQIERYIELAKDRAID